MVLGWSSTKVACFAGPECDLKAGASIGHGRHSCAAPALCTRAPEGFHIFESHLISLGRISDLVGHRMISTWVNEHLAPSGMYLLCKRINDIDTVTYHSLWSPLGCTARRLMQIICLLDKWVHTSGCHTIILPPTFWRCNNELKTRMPPGASTELSVPISTSPGSSAVFTALASNDFRAAL